MNNVVLCPTCGGRKIVSKPSYIMGDVNSWASNGTSYSPCPTCDGHGWIRVDSVAREDFDCVKSVALSSMETAENLMDECVKRADKIKELEAQVYSLTEQRDRFARVNTRLMRKADEQYYTLCEHVAYTHLIESERDSTIRYLTKEHNNHIEELETRCDNLNKACERREISILKGSDKLNTKNILLGDMLLQNESEIERLRMKILDIEGREDLVVTELEARVCTKDLRISELKRDREMVRKTYDAREEELLGIINDLTNENHRLENVVDTCTAAIRDLGCVCNGDSGDLEMLDSILEIVNPLIKSGAYAKPAAESRLLSIRMHGLCQTVVQFRRKHNIVG